MDVKILTEACSCIQKAVSLEASGNHRMAASKYIQAVGVYVNVLQDNSLSSNDRSYIIANLAKYTSRAEELLKTDLETTTPKRKKKNHQTPRLSEKKKHASELESAVMVTKPTVTWNDVIGLEDAKGPMKEAVLIPLIFPGSPQAKYAHKGLLLFGPGGVGKTELCKPLANEANNATFINVRPDMLLSKWVGESEKMIRELFDLVRQRKPTIIFFDEVDSFCSSRTDESDGSRRFKNSLLCEMDGMDDMSGVFVVGATNQPFAIDSSFLRRFPLRLYVSLPDVKARTNIVTTKLQPYNSAMTKSDIRSIALKTEGYSGSDLQTLVTEAGLGPYREILATKSIKGVRSEDYHSMRPVSTLDFKHALKKCSPANPAALVRKLEQWNLDNGDGALSTDIPSRKSPTVWQTFVDVFGIPF